MTIYASKVRSAYDLREAFKNKGHSYPFKVFKTLFDYLEELSETTGTFIDLDDFIVSGSFGAEYFPTYAKYIKFLKAVGEEGSNIEKVLYADPVGLVVHCVRLV